MNSRINRATVPTKRDMIRIRLLVGIGLLSTLHFLLWFFKYEHIGNLFLFSSLTFVVLYKIWSYLVEWIYYASIKVPPEREMKRDWTVDLLTTFVPGEPYEMIEETLKAMVAVKYPHKTYLCDEGNDPYLKNLCEQLGVIHVYRGKDKTGAKAGNINYALRNKAQGEICVILDPDHIPVPEFLDRVLPYFEDEKVGYVQCVQGYYNRNESLVAKGAAEQTYMFYGPIMMGMHRHGTVQAIGANCTFRRAALDSINGHATGLCEDMHTSMQLHARGWQSVYIPEMLSKGLVPTTLSAYYKQQLKWSRGSFDLLFNSYPKLFSKWTWKQRLHYTLAPVYFLNGLMVLLSLLIPIVSLLTAYVPLHIDLKELVLFGSPMLISAIFIKQYMQRFLMQEHESGFHILGGILKLGSWWIFLTGFIYSLIRKKVPYIPTPKGDELADEWKLAIPNIIFMILSGWAIYKGLGYDYTPYSLIMAAFAVVNILFLLTATLIAFQRSLAILMKKNINWIHPFRLFWYVLRHHYFYNALRKPVAVISSISYSFLMIILLNFIPIAEFYKENIQNTREKEFGNILQEVEFQSVLTPSYPEEDFTGIAQSVLDMRDSFYLLRLDTLLLKAGQHGVTPYIDVRGDAANFIARIKPVADKLRQFNAPVLMTLSFSNIDKSRGKVFYNKRTKALWLLANEIFEDHAATNVAWVWKAGPGKESLDRFPGTFFADLVEWSMVNNAGMSEPCSLGNFLQKPLLIETNSPMITDCLELSRGYGFISQNNNLDKFSLGINTSARVQLTSQQSERPKEPFSWKLAPDTLYIKGIAYNPGHDWRDGNWPLTRRQLEADFEDIKRMGANTIRRYGKSIYDYNILQEAKEHELWVMYGFWFDPAVDYFKDKERVQELKDEVLELVEKYKKEPSILCWVIGNETWGQLKHHFHKPYLTKVRKAYIDMIEALAQDIRQIDSSRVILSALEFSGDVAGGMYQFDQWAPSLDAIAVNAYYHQDLKQLQEIDARWNPDRPYIISEFGPEGYWDLAYTDTLHGRPLEQSSFEKARMYAETWDRYVEANKQWNLGGVAYCWRDRMEGTATWFGITDYYGRFKPAFYALKNIWTGSNDIFPIEDAYLANITNPQKDGNRLAFKVVSPNNYNHSLSYEWVIRKNEFLYEEDHFDINYEDQGYFIYKLREEIRERLTKYGFPQEEGRAFKYHASKAMEDRRIYILITDKAGHVVTASYPF